MSAPEPGRPPSPTSRRERLVGLLVLGVAAVLLVSAPTWYASDQTGVAIAQLAVALMLVVVGGLLVRRATRG